MRRRWDFVKRQVRAGSALRLTGSPVGIDCPRPELRLTLRRRDGTLAPLTFVLDTGADHLVIPMRSADIAQLPYTREFPGTAETQGGKIAGYYGWVTVWSHLAGKEFRWPCLFTAEERDRLLLGRAGFLNEFGVTLVDDQLVVFRLGPVGRLLEQLRRRWHKATARVKPWDPL